MSHMFCCCILSLIATLVYLDANTCPIPLLLYFHALNVSSPNCTVLVILIGFLHALIFLLIACSSSQSNPSEFRFPHSIHSNSWTCNFPDILTEQLDDSILICDYNLVYSILHASFIHSLAYNKTNKLTNKRKQKLIQNKSKSQIPIPQYQYVFELVCLVFAEFFH